MCLGSFVCFVREKQNSLFKFSNEKNNIKNALLQQQIDSALLRLNALELFKVKKENFSFWKFYRHWKKNWKMAEKLKKLKWKNCKNSKWYMRCEHRWRRRRSWWLWLFFNKFSLRKKKFNIETEIFLKNEKNFGYIIFHIQKPKWNQKNI